MVRASNGHSVVFTDYSYSDSFEVRWAWVNEDSRFIQWHVIKCASLDEMQHAISNSLPDECYTEYAAPEHFMHRLQRCNRMTAPRKEEAFRKSQEALYLACEVPF